MDLLPLFSALAGALIGAATSILTTLLPLRHQTLRELKKVAIEFARDDFHFRVQDKSGQLDALPASVLIYYYDRLIDLARQDRLSTESIRDLLRKQAELYTAIQEEVRSWRAAPPKSGDPQGKGT